MAVKEPREDLIPADLIERAAIESIFSGNLSKRKKKKVKDPTNLVYMVILFNLLHTQKVKSLLR
jgi:hypothetical protein